MLVHIHLITYANLRKAHVFLHKKLTNPVSLYLLERSVVVENQDLFDSWRFGFGDGRGD